MTTDTPASAPSANELVRLILLRLGAPDRARTVDAIVDGDGDAPVRRVAVTTMATLDVLAAARERGADVVITHEPLYYDHHDAVRSELSATADPVFAAKRRFVAESGIRVWRLHDHVHDLQPDRIDQGLAEAMGWRIESVDPAGYTVAACDPTTLAALAGDLRMATDSTSLRCTGSPNHRVERLALDLGFRGFHRNRRALSAPGIDAVLVGEAHEWETGAYAADVAWLTRHDTEWRAARRPGALIVVGHVPSEQTGMAWFARWLSENVTEVSSIFLPTADLTTLAGCQPTRQDRGRLGSGS